MHDISRRSFAGALALALAAMIPGRLLLAAEATPVAKERVALTGYDPVSYFTDGRPEKGSAQYQAAFDGATYWFKNEDHRALFVADPDHYAPQFSGFCAVSLSRGEKYEADPSAWAIADGKLYVFAAKEGVPLFQRQTASLIAKASGNWAELRRAQ